MATLSHKLNELYKICAAYNEGYYNQPITIIEEAAKIYVEHKKEFPNDLKEPFGKCMAFINQGLERYITIEECCELGGELIEDVTGYIGEYLA